MAIRFQYQVPAGMVGAYASGQAGARRRQRKYEIDLLSQQQRHAQRMAELAARRGALGGRRGALGRRGAAGGGGRLVDPLSAGSKYHGSAWGTMTPDTTGTQLEARPKTRSVEAAPIDRKTEADYGRAFEKALAAGGVPLAGAADTPAGPPPAPRPWPRSVTAAPIGDPPTEEELREGMARSKGSYYATGKPIKHKKPLPDDPFAWTPADYKRSKEETAARDAAAKKWNAPDAVRNRAKWAAKKASRGASDPAAAAPAGTPGTATPSVSPGTPGVTMLSDGGAMVDPLATHPDFAATGDPLTPEQKNAQIRLRVQQKAQIKDAQRKYRLGKTPTATDLLPRHVSPEEVARQQEFAETTRVEGLARAKENRARKDRDRTLAAATAKGRRSYASSEIAGLEMPEWASRDDQLELRGKLRTLREFTKLDNDWNDPDLLKNYNDAIKDYRNTLAAMREKESKKYEIPFTERLRDYLEDKYGPGGYEKWKHLSWEATDDPDVFEAATLKEKEEPKEPYDKADLVRRFRRKYGKDDGEGGKVTAQTALEESIKEMIAEMEVFATLASAPTAEAAVSAPPDPAAEAPLELKPSGIEEPSVEAPAAGDPVAPPSAAPEAGAGAAAIDPAATPEAGIEDTTSAEAPAVVPAEPHGDVPSDMPEEESNPPVPTEAARRSLPMLDTGDPRSSAYGPPQKNAANQARAMDRLKDAARNGHPGARRKLKERGISWQ